MCRWALLVDANWDMDEFAGSLQKLHLHYRQRYPLTLFSKVKIEAIAKELREEINELALDK